jgi:hypothetical protein
MGVFTSGDISISCKNEKDAIFIFEQLENITKLVEARLKIPAYFDLQDNHVEECMFYCNVHSPRTQNGEFQMDQIIEQIKIMVKEGKIEPPEEFQGELMVQYESWHMSEDEFNPEED